MDPDEKYLIGYILGDGMVKYYPRHGYEVKLTEKDYRHINYLAELIRELYGINVVSIKDGYSKAWRIRIYSKAFYVNIKKSMNEAIRNPDKHFVGGLFDAEGDYTASKQRLRFTNKKHDIIVVVEKFLKDSNIKYHTYTRRKGEHVWYNIEIYGSYAFKTLNKLDLRHPKWRSIIHTY